MEWFAYKFVAVEGTKPYQHVEYYRVKNKTTPCPDWNPKKVVWRKEEHYNGTVCMICSMRRDHPNHA